MKRKLVVSILLLSTLMTALTGCGGNDEISQLNSISALNNESSVTSNYNLSWSDEQEMIYAQVSDRQLLDLSALSACSESEIQQVRSFMDNVDNQLIGQVNVQEYAEEYVKELSDGLVEDDSVVDAKLTDYLLTFMEQTPYYWQRTKTTIRGIDSRSGSIIVDVTYKTIDTEKDIMPDSTIVKGDPNYSTLAESRYVKWVNILSTEYNNPSNPNLLKYKEDFKKYWGDPEAIIEEQRRHASTADIYLTGMQKTYNGLIDSPAEQCGGIMTVRYVLVPEYVLGINLGVSCEHMYITEFKLDSDITEGLSAFTAEGYQTVTDNIYNLIYSYFTCIDESDFEGLYKLTNNFASLDKHYENVFDSSYQKHQGYSVSLFDITGTHIKCGVTISTKERAKNSNMTMPVYTDRYYMELELVDDTLKVSNMVLLNRRLEGEPDIAEDDLDKTGFTATIDLDNDDRVEIENLICNFSAVQLNADTTSDNFTNVVDSSITTNQLSALKTNMTSLSGARKVVFLQNYQQGTASYASVRCKELFQDSTNAIVEANVTYEFIMKGGRWYIYNYDVNSSVKLDTTNLQTTGSLCLVSPGKVEAYTSQIKGTVSTNLDEVSDISVSFDHKAYTPVRKEGVVEQGLVLYEGDDITETQWIYVANAIESDLTTMSGLESLVSSVSNLEDDTTLADDTWNVIFDTIAVYYNTAEGRYPTDSDALVAKEEISESLSAVLNRLSSTQQDIDDADIRRNIDNLVTILQNLKTLVRG